MHLGQTLLFLLFSWAVVCEIRCDLDVPTKMADEELTYLEQCAVDGSVMARCRLARAQHLIALSVTIRGN